MVTCASGIELLDGLRQKMRRGMADDLQPFRITLGDDGQRRVGIDEVAGVDEAAVDLASQRRTRQARTNALRHLRDRHGLVEGALSAIRQRDNRHGSSVEIW